MTSKEELVSYSMDFASYLKLQFPQIKQIILFGSVARGNFDEESDIDIFLDVKDKTYEKKIKKWVQRFYNTEKSKKWELRGITNDFSVIIGNVDSHEWDNLRRSMMSDAFVLYGRYESHPKKMEQYFIITFGDIKNATKRVSLYRRLFGYTVNKRRYTGLVEKYNGKKLGAGVIFMPAKSSMEIETLFKKKKLNYKIFEVWSDSV